MLQIWTILESYLKGIFHLHKNSNKFCPSSVFCVKYCGETCDWRYRLNKHVRLILQVSWTVRTFETVPQTEDIAFVTFEIFVTSIT